MPYAPVGSLCCTDGFSAVFFSPTGTLLHTLSLPASPGGIIHGNACQLPTGEIMVSNGLFGSGSQEFFDSQFASVASASVAPGGTNFGGGSCSQTHFFVINGSGFTKFNSDGTVHSTASRTGGARHFGVDWSGANAFHTYRVGSPDQYLVKKTVLGGATSTIEDRTAVDAINEDPGNPTCLQDDATLIVSWFDDVDSHSVLRAISPSGSTIWDVDLGASASDFTVAVARGADASYFWIAYYLDASPAVVFKKINASSGSVISSFTKGTTESGVSMDNMAFFELLVAFGTPPGPPPPTTPTTTLINSTPACIKSGAPAQNAAGDIFPVGPGWTPSCPGGGVVPTAADVTLVEAWDF